MYIIHIIHRIIITFRYKNCFIINSQLIFINECSIKIFKCIYFYFLKPVINQ